MFKPNPISVLTNFHFQVYAPDRGPPLLDFLFVLTAFFAAVFAAYYTIFTETGLS